MNQEISPLSPYVLLMGYIYKSPWMEGGTWILHSKEAEAILNGLLGSCEGVKIIYKSRVLNM